jgi:hypothetical protein
LPCSGRRHDSCRRLRAVDLAKPRTELHGRTTARVEPDLAYTVIAAVHHQGRGNSSPIPSANA